MPIELPEQPAHGKKIPTGWDRAFYNSVSRLARHSIRGDGKTMK
jgi:hypothetical protein